MLPAGRGHVVDDGCVATLSLHRGKHLGTSASADIMLQVDCSVFPDGYGVTVLTSGRLLNLGCATGHPSFVMSGSITNKAYKNDVCLLPKELDENIFDIITAKHIKQKNKATVGNIGHFDNVIDMADLGNLEGIKVENKKPQVDRCVFTDRHGITVLMSGRLLNLGCVTGHPSFVLSCSITNQVLAQLDFMKMGRKPRLTGTLTSVGLTMH